MTYDRTDRYGFEMFPASGAAEGKCDAQQLTSESVRQTVTEMEQYCYSSQTETVCRTIVMLIIIQINRSDKQMKSKRVKETHRKTALVYSRTPGLHRKHPCYNCPLAKMYGNKLFCFTPRCMKQEMFEAITRDN